MFSHLMGSSSHSRHSHTSTSSRLFMLNSSIILYLQGSAVTAEGTSTAQSVSPVPSPAALPPPLGWVCKSTGPRESRTRWPRWWSWGSQPLLMTVGASCECPSEWQGRTSPTIFYQSTGRNISVLSDKNPSFLIYASSCQLTDGSFKWRFPFRRQSLSSTLPLGSPQV